MTFKSKLPWPDFGTITRTRHGTPQGAATEQRMVGRIGGPETIRKDYRTNPDGSVTMAHTRGPGTQPEIITPPVERKETTEKGRTFVFTLIGGKSATVANRHLLSSAFDIVKRKVAVGAARYFVAATKIASLIATTWDDVWRLDGTKLSTNGKTPKLTKAVSSPVNDKSMLPFVLLKDGKYTDNTPVFAGYSSVGKRGVAVSVEGALYESAPEFPELYERRSSAGVYVNSVGEFKFIGGTVLLNGSGGSGGSGGSVKQAASLWTAIQCANTPPYLSVSGSSASAWTLGAATGKDVELVTTTETFSLSNTNFITGYFGCDTSVMRGTGDNIAAYSIAFTFNPSRKYPHNRRLFTGTQTRGVASVSDSQQLSAYLGSGLDMVSSAAMSGTILSVAGSGNEYQYSEVLSMGPAGNSAPYSYYATIPTMSNLLSQEPWITYRFFSMPVLSTSTAKPRAFSGDATEFESHFSTSSELSLSGLKTPYRSETTVDYSFFSTRGTYAIDVIDDPSYPDNYGAYSNNPDEVEECDYLVSLITSIDWYVGASDLLDSSEYRNTARSSFVISHTASTVDYVFADIAEEVFLTFESDLAYTYSEIDGVMTHTYNLTVRYVLSVHGLEHTLQVFSGSNFTNPLVRLTNAIPSNRDSRGESTNSLGAYHSGYVGTPIFSPPFMAQGNCPYIAYTTKHEEQNGANPEFYMDFNLLPCQHTDIPNADDADLYTGTTRFCPHQFLLVYRKYLGGEDPTTFMLTRNQNLWAQLFPRATRFQFANGIIGPWQSALGDPFLSNPPVEISRT